MSDDEAASVGGEVSDDEDVSSTEADEDPDWEMAPDSVAEFPADSEKVAFLREIAEDVRRDSSESKQLSAILYRVSDLYDDEGDTSPEEIYLNVRHIMNIKAQGGIER